MAAGLVGLILLAAFLGFPETAYRRTGDGEAGRGSDGGRGPEVEKGLSGEKPARGLQQGQSGSYLRSLAVFTGTKTEESLLRIFLRPLGLILLPPVLWAALVQSVTVG